MVVETLEPLQDSLERRLDRFLHEIRATAGPHSLQSVVESCSVTPESSILEAIAALERGRIQLALVMGPEHKLLGLLTDGDLRRALLTGRPVTDSIGDVFRREFIRVDSAAGRAEVLDLMQSRQIWHIPVVDEDGVLHGLHLLTQMLRKNVRANAVCILAGGKGKRLLPLTENVPKPMLKVAGRPILERIILHLIGHGLHKFYLSVNYLSSQIQDHFGDGSQLGCSIQYLVEDMPLGTGGPLALIPETLKEPLLVMNGDLITQFNAGLLLDAHSLSGAALTVASRLYQHSVPFGCLSLDNGRVKGLEEKPMLVKHVNAGIYVLDPEVVARIPRGSEYPITNLIDSLVQEGAPVMAYELQDDWIDVGQKDDLERARGGS